MDRLKDNLAKMARTLRALFALLGCDVAAYSDADLVDALLFAAPEVHAAWPSDDEVRKAFERLTARE